MLRRIVVLVAVAISSFAVAPASSAAHSFTTTLTADIVFVDGNCCGTVYLISGRIRGHQIPGVRPGTFTADLLEGTFFPPEPGDEPSDPRAISFTYTARGGKGTLALKTPFPHDDSNSFRWVVTDATGIYAGWTGSGTYSYEITWFDDSPELGPFGEVSLTLTGEIGPS
jgi:hypothetical protein